MSKQEHRVSVSNDKYTFISPADHYAISILRYGEAWHGPQEDACNALHSIMCELDAARVVLEAARATIASKHEGTASIGNLERALELHGRLCDDRAAPSAWCR